MTHATIFERATAVMAPTTALLDRAQAITAAFAPPAALTDFNRRVAEMADTLTFKKD